MSGGAGGYNIPVSVSNAQAPSSGVSSPTYIQFGNGYLSGDNPLSITPTSTATSAAAEGNASATQGSSGAGASASGTTGSELTGGFNYPVILSITAIALVLIGGAVFVGTRIRT